MIEKFAKVLGVAPQLIKDLEEDSVTVIIEKTIILLEIMTELIKGILLKIVV